MHCLFKCNNWGIYKWSHAKAAFLDQCIYYHLVLKSAINSKPISIIHFNENKIVIYRHAAFSLWKDNTIISPNDVKEYIYYATHTGCDWLSQCIWTCLINGLWEHTRVPYHTKLHKIISCDERFVVRKNWAYHIVSMANHWTAKMRSAQATLMKMPESEEIRSGAFHEVMFFFSWNTFTVSGRGEGFIV